MRTYNRAVVLGHAGNEPILRHTKSGKAVLNLSVATNSKRRDGPEETTWHRIVFWDRLAEIVSKRVRKGSPLYIEGSMSATEWTDREDRIRVLLDDDGDGVADRAEMFATGFSGLLDGTVGGDDRLALRQQIIAGVPVGHIDDVPGIGGGRRVGETEVVVDDLMQGSCQGLA